MPSKPKRPCNNPGCPELTTERYCEKHQKEYDQRVDQRRGSASSRGYDYKWQKARASYLKSHPLCVECLKNDKLTPAALVHHVKRIKDGGSVLDHSNLMCLCVKCHDKIHNEQGHKW